MKKLKYLCLLPFIALTACNANSKAGVYAFQLGKNMSTHVAATVELKNSKYVVSDPTEQAYYDSVGAKNFGLSVDILTKDLVEIFPTGLQLDVDGYYYLGKDDEVKGTKVNFGFVAEIPLPELFLDPGDDPHITIPEDIIELLVDSYITSRSFDLYVPVSLDDLKYQFYWYGYIVDFDWDNGFTFELLSDKYGRLPPGPSGDPLERVGTHPTDYEIEQFNSIYPEEFSGEGKNPFRDYYTVKIGLLKA